MFTDLKHLWYSPECRLWCLWSHLNCQKSLELFEKIMTGRWENLWQIALGIALHRIQMENSRHFHMEQPFGSTMLKVPGTQSITENTMDTSSLPILGVHLYQSPWCLLVVPIDPLES